MQVMSSKCTQPLISVVPALGFLPGKEVKDAEVGNLGLQDRKSAAFFFDEG
jgi:hypothetical protein